MWLSSQARSAPDSCRVAAKGEHLPGAFVIVIVVVVIRHLLDGRLHVSHAWIPFSHGCSALRPRYTRDFTVPSGAPVTTAISSNDIPS